MQAGLPRIGLRVRLFLISVLLIALVGTASAVLLRASLRGLLERRITAELEFRAEAVRILVESLDPPAEVEPVGRLVGAFAQDGQSPRITVTTSEGVVLADSRPRATAEAPTGEEPMLMVEAPYRTDRKSVV